MQGLGDPQIWFLVIPNCERDVRSYMVNGFDHPIYIIIVS
jgi:hypothetical protein